MAKMKDSMHLGSGKHPFQGNGRTPKPAMGRTVGLSSSPGGAGDKISANAVMTKKRPLNGPGDAK